MDCEYNTSSVELLHVFTLFLICHHFLCLCTSSSYTHLEFAPNTPKGGARQVEAIHHRDRWADALCRKAMCGSLSAFGDDLVSHPRVHTGPINIW